MKLKEGLSDNEFKELILNILKDNSEYEKDQYKFLPIDDLPSTLVEVGGTLLTKFFFNKDKVDE